MVGEGRVDRNIFVVGVGVLVRGYGICYSRVVNNRRGMSLSKDRRASDRLSVMSGLG
jgi:hypothetical protein